MSGYYLYSKLLRSGVSRHIGTGGAELGAIGRNLNQIARAVNQGDRVVGPTREDLRAILRVCEALRDNVKQLIRTNVNTWEIGYAETER